MEKAIHISLEEKQPLLLSVTVCMRGLWNRVYRVHDANGNTIYTIGGALEGVKVEGASEMAAAAQM
jgi:hypothetical protein